MRVLMLVVVIVVMLGCGAPRGAGVLARREAGVAGALAVMPADEAGVKEALRGQAEAWGRLAAMLRERELGGIAVEERFVELVEQTAALARRQKELIEQGKDDPVLDRAALQKLRALWADAARYLGQ